MRSSGCTGAPAGSRSTVSSEHGTRRRISLTRHGAGPERDLSGTGHGHHRIGRCASVERRLRDRPLSLHGARRARLAGALRRPRLPRGVRPSAAAFQVEEDRGARRLRVRVPGARSVELAGDFTNWQPIALRQGDTDEWEVTLPIAPGVHRIAIRVDGDSWTTPPGVAAVADEFQGTVGVIVVRLDGP